MEPYQSPSMPASLVVLLIAAAIVLFVVLEELLRRRRSGEKRTRWASTIRDLITALSSLAIIGSLWLWGMALPIASLLGCTLALALIVLGFFFRGKMRRSWRLVLPLAFALAAPILLAPTSVARYSLRFLELLFPSMFPGW